MRSPLRCFLLALFGSLALACGGRFTPAGPSGDSDTDPVIIVSPGTVELAVGNSQIFVASEGTAPYVFGVQRVAGEPDEALGTIDPDSGEYTAPAHPGRNLVIVTDAQGFEGTARVSINDALRLKAADNHVPAGGSSTFIATDGVPPYVYSLDGGGGSIDAITGAFTASDTEAVVVVRVTDARDNTTTASLAVTPRSGALDESFGDLGVVRTRVQGPSLDFVAGSTWDSAGRLVVAGSTQDGLSTDLLAMAVTAEGTLDRSFAVDGVQRISSGSGPLVAADILRLLDGRYLLLGTLNKSGDSDLALAMLNEDGSIDEAFGSAGLAFVDLGPLAETPIAAALRQDGRIVIIGDMDSGARRAVLVAQLSIDGQLDASFGGGTGLVTIAFVGVARDNAADVLVDSSDRIVVTGTGWRPDDLRNSRDAGVARLLGDGSLDSTFGSGGVALIDRNGNNGILEEGGAVLETGTGALVFSVTSGWEQTDPPTGNHYLLMLSDAGVLEPSFGTDGWASTVNVNHAPSGALALRADGTILAAGATTRCCPLLGSSYVWPVTADGTSADRTPLWAGPTRSVHVLSDGAALAAGHTVAGTWRVTRLSADLAVDATFATEGHWSNNVGGTLHGELCTVTVDNAGQIMAVGTAEATAQRADIIVATYDRTGAPITDGVQPPIQFHSLGATGREHINAAVPYPDGRIALLGTTDAGPATSVVMRRLTDGTMDPPILDTFHGSAHAGVVQADGKLVVAGTAGDDFVLVRFKDDGGLDSGWNSVAFGLGGRTYTDFDWGSDAALALKQTDKGALIAAGYATVGGRRQFAMARYSEDGWLDAEFGDSGRVVTPVGSGDAEAHGLIITADGEIILVGHAQGSADMHVAFARYTADGNPVEDSGQATLLPTPGDARVAAVVAQPDGSLLVAGDISTGESRQVFVLRLDSSGLPDPHFGVGGWALIDTGSTYDRACGLVREANGRIVVAGSTERDSVREPLLVRLWP